MKYFRFRLKVRLNFHFPVYLRPWSNYIFVFFLFSLDTQTLIQFSLNQKILELLKISRNTCNKAHWKLL